MEEKVPAVLATIQLIFSVTLRFIIVIHVFHMWSNCPVVPGVDTGEALEGTSSSPADDSDLGMLQH